MNKNSGITLIEILIIIIVVSLFAIALLPQIRTAYNSWRRVDRRMEVLQTASVGSDKLIRDLRQSYILEYTATPSQYIEFVEGATGNNNATRVFRFPDAGAKAIEYGSTPSLSVTPYTSPITPYYTTGYRRATPYYSVTYAKRVVAFENYLSAEDSDGEAEDIPLQTWVYPRVNREGFTISRSDNSGVATDCEIGDFATYDQHRFYDKSDQDDVCVKIFTDRVNFDNMTIGSGGTAKACLCRQANATGCRNSFKTNNLCTNAILLESTSIVEATPTWYFGINDVSQVTSTGNRIIFIRIEDNDGEEYYQEDIINVQN